MTGPGAHLPDIAWAMLNSALGLYRDNPRATGWLRHHRERFEEPLRVAVAGPRGVGKSTLVNALVGEEIAPVGLPGHQAVTWFQDAAEPRATVYPPHGQAGEAPIGRIDAKLQVDLREWRPDQLGQVVIDVPTRALRDLVLIDNPALPTDEDQGEALDRITRQSDAVLYVGRHGDAEDLAVMRAATDNPVSRAAPVNLVLVLARADEIGGGRIDALTSARQIARRYRGDVNVRGACQDVIAIAGLIAQAGRTMRENEFAALAKLSAVDRTVLDDALLSAERFTAAEVPIGLSQPDRHYLFDRLGLFGLRLTTTLLRRGYDSQITLSAQLVQRSGLRDLREAIAQSFVERREVLKARSALLGLDTVLRSDPRPEARKLALDLERALANAHDFRELRLLATLRAGRLKLPEELAEEAHRLIGGQGVSLPARLNLDEAAAGGGELNQAIIAALSRWRRAAENPLLSADQRRAAQIVVRSCEGMISQLHPGMTG
ncbi:MAG TPA: hypothetical protein VG756_20955 [Pseudonocardiaceae bacterium]|jgi:energy-coupling factor transporter ATP-binding protein EcfA2|nr:hypothetical protein [Pseudonocardiaceae bacterium]